MGIKALILAAGRGSRLQELTKEKPKCLQIIAGRTLLEWQIESLRRGGVHEISIVTGYRSEMLESFGIKTIYNSEWSTSNMVKSLLCAQKEFDCSLIVSYSDIIYGPGVVSTLLSCNDDIVVTYDVEWEKLWRMRFDHPLDDAETFTIATDGRIQEIGKRAKSISNIQGQYIGLMRFTPKALSWVSDFTKKQEELILNTLDMTSLLQHLIHQDYPVYGMPIHGGWCEVDTPKDLMLANELYAQGRLAIA